jgi:hypothetical protein
LQPARIAHHCKHILAKVSKQAININISFDSLESNATLLFYLRKSIWIIVFVVGDGTLAEPKLTIIIIIYRFFVNSIKLVCLWLPSKIRNVARC